MPDFEITTADLVKTIHHAEFAPSNFGVDTIGVRRWYETDAEFRARLAGRSEYVSTSMDLPSLVCGGTAATDATANIAPAWAGKTAHGLLAEMRDLQAEIVKHPDARRATISLGGRRHGKSWFLGDWLARQANQYETMWVEEGADLTERAWLLRRAIRTDTAKTYADRSAYGDFVDHVRNSDAPGIAAMAAKNVQPTPEPVLSVGGQKTTEREITQALQLLRGQNAPAVKETPRGLMVVREFDHRLGAWKG